MFLKSPWPSAVAQKASGTPASGSMARDRRYHPVATAPAALGSESTCIARYRPVPQRGGGSPTTHRSRGQFFCYFHQCIGCFFIPETRNWGFGEKFIGNENVEQKKCWQTQKKRLYLDHSFGYKRKLCLKKKEKEEKKMLSLKIMAQFSQIKQMATNCQKKSNQKRDRETSLSK